MDSERYHRQIILNGFGEAAQAKLANAKVLVVGAGGLGCPVLQYLVAAGVGSIGIVDDDTIDLNNLHRQILYTHADLGKPKTEVAAKRLSEMNPEINVFPHHLRIGTNNVQEIIAPYDFIFDGTDNFETRYLINDTCAQLKKPLIFAAVSGFEGQLAIFNVVDENGISTNYRDLFPIQPQPGEIANCAENGILGVLPGIIGSMAAAEIIKLITNIGKPLINKLLHYHLLTGEQYELTVTPGKDYDFVKPARIAESYGEINAEQLAELANLPSTLLVDVREKHELPALDSQRYTQIPMSTFDAFLETTVAETNIVLICQHGIRSVAAAEALHEKYGDTKYIYSLKGGIAKWRNYFTP